MDPSSSWPCTLGLPSSWPMNSRSPQLLTHEQLQAPRATAPLHLLMQIPSPPAMHTPQKDTMASVFRHLVYPVASPWILGLPQLQAPRQVSTPSPQPYSSCWYTETLLLTPARIQTYKYPVDPSSNWPEHSVYPAADPQILLSPVVLCIETDRWVSWSTSRPHSLHSSRPGPPGPSVANSFSYLTQRGWLRDS